MSHCEEQSHDTLPTCSLADRARGRGILDVNQKSADLSMLRAPGILQVAPSSDFQVQKSGIRWQCYPLDGPDCEALPSAAKPFSMDWFKGQIIGNTHDLHRNLSMVSCNFPMGVSYGIYHLVICCIAMENPPIFKFGKPSISMGHLSHGYVSHNQRVNYHYIITINHH